MIIDTDRYPNIPPYTEVLEYLLGTYTLHQIEVISSWLTRDSILIYMHPQMYRY